MVSPPPTFPNASASPRSTAWGASEPHPLASLPRASAQEVQGEGGLALSLHLSLYLRNLKWD